jgi:hypothetical protein
MEGLFEEIASRGSFATGASRFSELFKSAMGKDTMCCQFPWSENVVHHINQSDANIFTWLGLFQHRQSSLHECILPYLETNKPNERLLIVVSSHCNRPKRTLTFFGEISNLALLPEITESEIALTAEVEGPA